MKHVTFDLETLGNTFKAPIVQIAAVKFTDDVIFKSNTFNAKISFKSLDKLRNKFDIDLNTLQWWFSNDDKVIKSVMCDEDRMGLHEAIHKFHIWLGKPTEYNCWSHATFDPVILRHTLEVIGYPNFIPFRKHRDIRTLTHLAGEINVQPNKGYHDALNDALYQAEYIIQGLKQMRNQS